MSWPATTTKMNESKPAMLWFAQDSVVYVLKARLIVAVNVAREGPYFPMISTKSFSISGCLIRVQRL